MTCHHDGRWSLLMPMRCKHFAAVILTTLVFRSLFAQGFDHDGSMQKTLELEGQQLLESVGDDTTESEIYYLDDLADRFESNYRDANVYPHRQNLVRTSPMSQEIRKNRASRDSIYEPSVEIVEGLPAKRSFFGKSLSMPEGSPWCGGAPTIWPVGHDPNEEPLCLSGATPTWKSLGEVKLDVVEPLNGENDGLKPEYYYCNNTCVDRHSCTYMNIDDNDTPDVICTTGAGGGEGFGYTEIYLTDDSGRLVKAPPDHGLQTKTTLSTRVIGKLRSAVDNSTLIFIGTNGQKRADGKTNKHQMFKHVSTSFPYFEKVNGPWSRYFFTQCAVTADVNRDGIDDLIVCHPKNGARIYIQKPDGTFRWFKPPKAASGAWKNVRVEDVTGDGIPDLIVANEYSSGQYVLTVYKGKKRRGTFNWRRPFYNVRTVFAIPDIEILDVNGDGRNDIYVVQTDSNKDGTYCSLNRKSQIELILNGEPEPGPDFLPPKDTAKDWLLVRGPNNRPKFEPFRMQHRFRGCGFQAERFGDNKTMVLTQGDEQHVGYTLLLTW